MTDPATLGGILAGGLARRMGGGDKGMRLVGGRSVLDRVIECMTPQVSRLVLNANDGPSRFADLGLPVVADGLPDRPGPLAGVLALLDWTVDHEPAALWVVTVPADAPFLPRDLVARLHAARDGGAATLAYAASGGWTHPVVALWPVSLREKLRHAVAVEGVRRIDAFTARYAAVAVEWSTDPVDPFFNVNTAEDLAEADRLSGFV